MKNSILTFISFWFLWTLIEYLFHRFVLHRKKLTKYIHDNKHHANVKFKPSELPFFIISIVLLTLGLYFSFYSVAGFGFGILVYVILHRLSHQRNDIRYLREHHKYHHLISSNHNFGITTNLWDFIFGTCVTGNYDYSEKKNKVYYE